jgi:hypothetical protein
MTLMRIAAVAILLILGTIAGVAYGVITEVPPRGVMDQ